VRFLLTNDDGITSDGLWAAARGLARVGHLTVMGTVDNWSSGSASTRDMFGARITRFRDIPADVGPNVEAYSIDSAPGAAILAGVMSDLFEPFDAVVSGANYGVNIGYDLLHSGTLGAAATGFQRGITAFGISAERGVNRGEPQRWDGVSDVTERIARWIGERDGRPVLLNVNVPNLVFANMRGGRLVRPVAWGNYDRAIVSARSDGEGGWRLTAELNHAVQYPDDPDTDSGAVKAGWIAISQVVPTGWADEPAPPDLERLLEALAPGGAAPTII
jgi:5'-nucleotidase